MKKLSVLLIVLLAAFSFTAANAQVRHKHVVVVKHRRHHVIVRHHMVVKHHKP
jgi:hypothetical protein